MKHAAVAVLVVVAAVAVVAAREGTMSRHRTMPPDSTMEVVVEAERNVGYTGLEELVVALFQVCQLEVATDPVGAPARDGDRFTFVVRPALDDTDRRQLHGCIEDARIDHLQAGVVHMRRLG